jgi:hypothetical protein
MVGKKRMFRSLKDNTFNVDAKIVNPGDYIELDADRCVDLGIPALIANKYLEEVK